MDINYVLKDCDCGQEKIATKDCSGEDIRLWEVYEEVIGDNKSCDACGVSFKISVAYFNDFVPGMI